MKSNLQVDLSWLDSLDVNVIPVQVIGPEVWEFPNLLTARKKFPELDPNRSTRNFTCAMHGELNGAPALRFETWTVYEALSD